MKKVLYALITIIGFGNATMAQVPSYVPTNGLSCYWPFSGNANDQSINAKNGIVQNAVLTTDRFGTPNSAYYFNGTNSFIKVPDNSDSILDLTQNFTISVWASIDQLLGNGPTMLSKHIGNIDNMGSYEFIFGYQTPVSQYKLVLFATPNYNNTAYSSFNSFPSNTWVNYVCTYNYLTQNCIYYVNGIAVDTVNINYDINNTTIDFLIGCTFLNNTSNYAYYFKGKLDEIGIWKRTLTAQEITNLYRGCGDSIITNQPTNANVGIGLNAQFTITSATGSAYQWQTNPLNIGWMNVPANSHYNGVNTNTLGVNSVSVSNHNQTFRALVNSNGCADTSNLVYLKVADTCLTKVTDTILTTVTDTLIIKTTVGLPTPNTTNTLLIYPNPAKDRITIDNGNYTVMAGYSIKIENSLGQQVFNSAITQAQFNIDLSTWTGKGIYFVRVLDTQGNVVTTRKILLQ